MQLSEDDLRELIHYGEGEVPDSVSRAVMWATIVELYRDRDEARALVRLVWERAKECADPVRRWHEEQL